jgi:hypothetical protein
VHDSGLSAELHSAHADGSVRSSGEDDYLMIVDANMHANKADYYIKKSADVKVEIYPSGLNRHQVLLHYEYPQPAQPDGTDHALNTDGRFINYVRLYLPETANLGSINYQVDGKNVPTSLGEISHEFGKTVIGVTFILDRGHTGDLSILYGDGLRPGNQYSLLVQKQAGIPERPTWLEVSYPGGIVNRRTALTHDEDFLIEW